MICSIRLPSRLKVKLCSMCHLHRIVKSSQVVNINKFTSCLTKMPLEIVPLRLKIIGEGARRTSRFRNPHQWSAHRGWRWPNRPTMLINARRRMASLSGSSAGQSNGNVISDARQRHTHTQASPNRISFALNDFGCGSGRFPLPNIATSPCQSRIISGASAHTRG